MAALLTNTDTQTARRSSRSPAPRSSHQYPEQGVVDPYFLGGLAGTDTPGHWANCDLIVFYPGKYQARESDDKSWHTAVEQGSLVLRRRVREATAEAKQSSPYRFLHDAPLSTTVAKIDDELLPMLNRELLDALEDLNEISEEAERDGFPHPSELARTNAEHILRVMYRIAPRRFEVYPTPDAEIAIDAPNGYGRSVLLLCSSNGDVLCLVNQGGKQRRQRYSTVSTLPDGFLWNALAGLKS